MSKFDSFLHSLYRREILKGVITKQRVLRSKKLTAKKVSQKRRLDWLCCFSCIKIRYVFSWVRLRKVMSTILKVSHTKLERIGSIKLRRDCLRTLTKFDWMIAKFFFSVVIWIMSKSFKFSHKWVLRKVIGTILKAAHTKLEWFWSIKLRRDCLQSLTRFRWVVATFSRCDLSHVKIC